MKKNKLNKILSVLLILSIMSIAYLTKSLIEQKQEFKEITNNYDKELYQKESIIIYHNQYRKYDKMILKAIKEDDEEKYTEAYNWFFIYSKSNSYIYYSIKMAHIKQSKKAFFDVFFSIKEEAKVNPSKNENEHNFMLYYLSKAFELGYVIDSTDRINLEYKDVNLKPSSSYLMN